MRPAATLAAYTLALAVVFGAAVGVGRAVGPVGTGADEAQHRTSDGSVHTAGTEPDPVGSAGSGSPARGLAVAQDGYALQLADTVQTPGTLGRLSFTITGPDGQPVTRYTREHDRDLHVVVVRRDLTGFQHLHPSRDAAGRWSVPLTLPAAGPYKVFADFRPAGRDTSLTLAADLTAPGAYVPQPPARPSRTASVDGYEVSLSGDLVAGTSSELTLTVTRAGRPVTDLQPYLAAYGHLVVLRDGDLAYLHVHPDGGPGDPGSEPGPEIVFSADVPTAGDHRLFLEFQHAGTVRTAAFTAAAGSGAATGSSRDADADAGHDDEHDAGH